MSQNNAFMTNWIKLSVPKFDITCFGIIIATKIKSSCHWTYRLILFDVYQFVLNKPIQQIYWMTNEILDLSRIQINTSILIHKLGQNKRTFYMPRRYIRTKYFWSYFASSILVCLVKNNNWIIKTVSKRFSKTQIFISRSIIFY